MTKGRLLLLVVALAGAAITVLGATTAMSASTNPTSKRAGHRSISAQRALGVFSHPVRLTHRQMREWAEIRREFRHAPKDSAVAAASFNDARPVHIADTVSADAWLTPDADGGVCTFIPDPSGGYGAVCASMNAVNAGHAVSMVGGAGILAHSAIVAVVEPNGAAAPTVETKTGKTLPMMETSNLATGIYNGGDTIVSGPNRIVVPDPQPPKCQPVGSDGTQCFINGQ